MSAPIAATVSVRPRIPLPALLAAAARGATVCEIDIVLTQDDEIVLLHDEILDRTTNGRGRVADQNLAALRRPRCRRVVRRQLCWARPFRR